MDVKADESHQTPPLKLQWESASVFIKQQHWLLGKDSLLLHTIDTVTPSKPLFSLIPRTAGCRGTGAV